MLKLDYDEISPITGEKSVLVEYDSNVNDTVKLCMTTGYQTYLNTWKISNEEHLRAYESQLPANIVETKIADESGNVWYKTVLQSPNVLLFPDEGDSGEPVWCVVPLSKLPTANDPNSMVAIGVPINADGDFETKFMDYSRAQYFGEFQFEEALFAFQSMIFELKNKQEN